MKTIFCVLAIACLVAAEIDSKVSDKIEVLRKRDLGKTLFATISMELQSSEPLDRLLDTLANLEQQYQNDQKEDDQSNSKFQSQCDQDLAAVGKDIALTETKKVEIQGVLDELKPILQQRQATLVAKNAFKTELQKEIDAVDLQRNQEAEEFEQKRQEMQLVVAVIQEAKRIFETSFSESFLQSRANTQIQPQIMTQLNQHFTKIAEKTGKQKFGKTFSHIFKFLASMTSNSNAGNSGLVQKIIKLCDLLLDKVDEAWTLERKAEEQRIQVYSGYKKLLNKDMNQYNSQIANLEGEIASLKDRLNATTNSFNEVQARLDDKTAQKNDRYAECQEAAFDYQARRKARDEDRDTVSQLIGIVHANLRDLKEYIALRLAAGDNLS